MSIHFFLTSKILFLKISLFQNFVSFFLFYFFQKKISRKFFYCSPYCSPKLQYNTPSFAIHLVSLAIHLHFPCNTIPSTTHSSCNTIRVLQYNFFSATAHSCNTILPYFNTLTQPTCKPHCNTIPYIAIQFSSPTSLVAIQLPSQQASSCNTIFQGCNTKKKKKKITRQLGSSPIRFCIFFFIYIFFFISSSYWKTLKIHV